MKKILILPFIIGAAFAQPFSTGFPQLKYNYSGCNAEARGLGIIYGLYTDIFTKCNAHFSYKPDPNVAISQAKITQFVFDYSSYGFEKKFVDEQDILIKKSQISRTSESLTFSFTIIIGNLRIQKHEKYIRLRAKLIVEYSNGIKQPFEVIIPVDY
jgi:hypothetical protein